MQDQWSRVDELAKSLNGNVRALQAVNVDTRNLEQSLQKVSAMSSLYSSLPSAQVREMTSSSSNQPNVRHALIAHSTQSAKRYPVADLGSVSAKRPLDPESAGFLVLKQLVNNAHYANPHLLPCVDVQFSEDNADNAFRVLFVRDNFPVVGWRKVLRLRLSGKGKGKLDISYERISSSGHVRRCLGRADVEAALEETRQMHLLDKFDFRNVFCVCQTPEDPTRPFLECSHGLCGCNAWVHPECVGLGSRSEEELREMKTIICPLCTAYFEGSQLLNRHAKETIALREITAGYFQNDVLVGDFEVEESNMPHHTWGLEGSGCCFKSTAPIFRPLMDKNNVIAKYLIDEKAREALKRSINASQIRDLPSFAPPPKKSSKKNSSFATSGLTQSIAEPNIGQGELALPASLKKRKVLLNDNQNVVVGVTGGYLAFDDVAPSEERSIAKRVHEKQIHTHPRTLSIRDALSVRESLLDCGQDLGRARKKIAGGYSQRLEVGESSGAFALTTVSDGGMRVVSISGYPFLPSLHSWCEYSLYCGFCFQQFEHSATEEKERLSLGSVSYLLHKQCKFLADHSVFLPVNIEESSVLRPLRFCRYEKQNDTSCDICGRTGGVLVQFDIDRVCVGTLPPNDESHWIAHVPCLQFLHHSSLLIPLDEKRKQQLVKLSQLTGSCSVNYNHAISAFDFSINQARCRLCNISEGVAVRCCGLNCTARAHPLCAMLSEGWKIVNAELDCLHQNKTGSAIQLLCSMHIPTSS